MKKIIILSTIPLLLTGCFSSNPTEELLSISDIQYEQPDFTINIDKNWETIEKNSFTSGVPQSTSVVFRNNLHNEIFTANINISKININDNSSAEDFALNSLEESRKKLTSFTEISSEEFKVPYLDSYLPAQRIVFQGKEGPSSVKIRFDQTYVINNKIGYTITGAYLPREEENVVNNIQAMLESFSLK